ncbi:MAG: GNAT family N-acetyltransferase [Chloroflexi bacterium]|nr:GNAT family N-acetyltransferase [Chloroflexota bacterium]
MTTLKNETQLYITVAGAPAIDGLRFRKFRGESDYPLMLETINASKTADHDERHDTLEDIRHNYSHLSNCDPYQDMLIAEINGQFAAYTRVSWWEEANTGRRLYTSVGFVRPEWRRKGLGRAMLHYNENRLREIAAAHPPEVEKAFQVFTTHGQVGLRALLEQEGYRPIRYFHEMVRPDLENIPDLPLPEGLEVRPVLPEHYRAIFDALQEAFQDHWSPSVQQEEDFKQWVEDPDFKPELFQVAWDGDQVAGMILNFIDEGENEEYSRKRGYTEDICVRRPWRRRGLARALLARSLKMHRDLGMTEAALNVDSDSLSGANKLYESMGFRIVRTNSVYRKDMA